MSASQTIAVLGTGTMGAPIAGNLASAGLEVRAWNRNRDRAAPLEGEGITVAERPGAAVAGADVVITMLPTGEIVREVIEPALGEFGSDAVWVQMSTVGAAEADSLGELAGSHGVTYVDAPVSGTKEPAEKGELVILASGPDLLRERLGPLFEVIGSRTLWLGPAGAGSRMKLVINNWLLAIVEGLAETVALAEGLKVDPARFLEAISGGPLDAPYAQLKGKAMLEHKFDPSFALAMAAKDAQLVREAVADAELDLPVAELIAERLERGVAADLGDKDVSAAVSLARGEA
ncbi:MAG TPA: NAD(P)-dependent oxidoreductase [Solirubrobacteraceae bacterium]